MFIGLPGGRPLFSWIQTGKNGKNQDVKSVKITIREKRKKQETGNRKQATRLNICRNQVRAVTKVQTSQGKPGK